MSQGGARWRIGVGVGLAVLLFTRLRTHVPPYVELHRWLAGIGVPDGVRNLDAALWLFCSAILGAAIADRRPWRQLGFDGRVGRGFGLALLISLPMLTVAAIVGSPQPPTLDLLRGTLIAGIVEETFFRGLLLAIVVRVGRRAFWPSACWSSLLFGAIHVRWDAVPDVGDLAPFAVTFAGGLWYAWLLRAHDWNLWLTIALHTAMNAAWSVFGIGGGAAGNGVWPNIGRALTIALGCWVTANTMRRRGDRA